MLILAISCFQCKFHRILAQRAIKHKYSFPYKRNISESSKLYFPVSNISKQDLINMLKSNTKFCLIDVRNPEEIAGTGSLDSKAHNVPLSQIPQSFVSSEETWVAKFGFPKPSKDETLVFSCKAGVRSAMASECANQLGYSDVRNYTGGADEWFST